MILALLATLGAVVVAFVLYPVFASEAPEPIGLDDTQSELRDLEEKKNQILSNIKDLDFEKASGKLSDADYESSRNDYVAQVSAVITRIDELAPQREQERKKEKIGEVQKSCAREQGRDDRLRELRRSQPEELEVLSRLRAPIRSPMRSLWRNTAAQGQVL